MLPNQVLSGQAAATLRDGGGMGLQPFLVAALLLIIAYFTNPSETSFRSFLTDLSFQLYLRKLRATPPQDHKATDSHILTFSNHVSIWLKTPRYKIQSCGIFTIVAMSPEHPSATQTRSASPFAASTTFFFGCFGRWWCLADSAENEALALKDRVASSVVALETTDDKRPDAVETPEYSDQEDGSPDDARSNRKPVKATFRAGSRRSTPSYRYHTKTRITTPTMDKPQGFPSPNASPLSSPRVGTLPPETSSASDDVANDAAERLAAQSISLLGAQIERIKTETAEAQVKLSEELEELRGRKKEEDYARAQLKSKSRMLEESKRLAEVDLHDSERKLAAARHQRHTLEDKMDRLKSELHRLQRKEADAKERLAKSRKDLEAQEQELEARTKAKLAEAAHTEQVTRALVEQVEALEHSIEERKLELVTRRQFSHLHRHSARATSFSSQTAPAQWATYGDAHGSGAHNPPTSSVASAFYSVPAQTDSPDRSPGSPPPSSPPPGFLEHRLAHRGMSPTQPSPSGRSSGHDSPTDPFATTFAPFGPSLTATKSIDSTHSGARNVSLPFFVSGHLTSLGEPTSPGEMQMDGPLSPVTPHQASLIPSQLFDMLDDDDDGLPASPTLEYRSIGQAHPECAENAFRFAAVDPPSRSSLTKTDPLRALSQEQLIAEDDLLSHQLRPPRHPLSLNPDAAAFSFPSGDNAAPGTVKGVPLPSQEADRVT